MLSSIKFDRRTKFIAYVWDDARCVSYIGNPKSWMKLSEDKLQDAVVSIMSHETIHLVLMKLISNRTSSRSDNLIDNTGFTRIKNWKKYSSGVFLRRH